MYTRPPKAFFPLLRVLSDGKFHSGEALARRFGLSRASVFNALGYAECVGLSLHAVRGRGYRLPEPIDWLDAGRVANHLAVAGHAHPYSIRLLDSVDSTNTALLEAAREGAPDGTVLCAEHQHGGRGRRGRRWHSVIGGSLTFSVLWRFEDGLQSLSGLSLAVGLAIARAIGRNTPHPVRLKWPNDVLVDFRKLAGILVEVQGDMHGNAFAVIGIGLNIRVNEGQRDAIDQAVVDLAEMGVNVGRNELLAQCLAELDVVIRVFRAHGFAALRDAWCAFDAYADRPVTLVMPNDSVRGIAAGVDDTGALLLASVDGTRTPYSGGEISLRVGTAP